MAAESAIDGLTYRPSNACGDQPSRADSLCSEQFRIEMRSTKGRVLITPIGEVDLATAEPLQDLLLEREADQPDYLVLDLRRLSFMDCSGLHVVLDVDARARQADRRLQVLCVPGQVRRLLKLTGADQYLELVEPLANATEPAAIKSRTS